MDDENCSLCLRRLDDIHPMDKRQALGYTWTGGNNAAPFKGRCCTSCDCLIVIPARLRASGMTEEQSMAFGIMSLTRRLNPEMLIPEAE
jgi:hypothetical protein